VSVVILRGDAACLPLADESVDAVVTDPPYGLEFMGREWDTFRPSNARIRERVDGRTNPGEGKSVTRTPEAYVAGRPFQAWCETWATECLRVLKPGGHLLAFGGTRTWHRLACAIEDAGFEIRESVADLTGIGGPGLLWMQGSGFPKSLDVSKAIDKAAGAQREVAGAGKWAGRESAADLGVMNDDSWQGGASRTVTIPATEDAARWLGWGTALKPAWEPIVVGRKPLAGTVAANVLEYGTGALNIDGCRVGEGGYDAGGASRVAGTRRRDEWRTGTTAGPHALADAGRWPPNVLLGEDSATELDRQSGTLTSGANPARRSSDKFRDAYGEFAGQAECTVHRGADSGGASRFFPVFRYEPKAAASERPRLPDGTAWPTVKPVALMQWLLRLVMPPGGTVLDLFCGTGPTGEAALIEGFNAVLLDKDPQAIALTRVRLARPVQPLMFGVPDPGERARALCVPKPPPVPDGQGSLFDDREVS
jgi:site-specific DNA-methyltransferase (adenine-specific)